MTKSSMVRLSDTVNSAMGRQKADLVIKNVSIINVIDGSIKKGDIAVQGNSIIGTYDEYHGEKEIDGSDLYAAPGFIDCHVHVESSMITPMEFDRCVLPHGTTTAMCDPHEASNVLGENALKYFQDASDNTVMDLFVQLSSCVPATKLETSGAELDAKTLMKYARHPNTVGLAEFMDIGGVLGLDPDTMEKLAEMENGHIDGHLPGITGYALNAMAACGICNCHESTDIEQAREKLAKGVQVFIREGTVCKDMDALHPLITTRLTPFLGFCTDDRNPLEIREHGHLDYLIKTAISKGADPVDVYRIASWSAAQGFGLHKNTTKWQRRGLIAPGFQADIVLMNDYKTCDINSVIKNGKPINAETFEKREIPKPIGFNSVHINKLGADDFSLHGNDMHEHDVIGLIKDQIVTEHLKMPLTIDENGCLQRDLENDVLKIAVLERHGRTGNKAIGFVKGFGFSEGAIACSVGHDSHNITCVGATDEDMALACNRIKEIQGGYVIVKNGEILGEVPLPIAGLMSDKNFEEVCKDLEGMRAASKELGSALEEPTMMLAFLPLCVIPSLKITDFGLVRFSPDKGDQEPVLIDDQRKDKPENTPAP
ncbi:MAG: adenine deaminase [Alphaproteobacteria bacterium]|nr:adenine deaminase [Alphaproteobacteria bacterium]